MRIRRETDSFNWSAWVKVFLFLLLVFNAAMAALSLGIPFTTFRILNGLLFPLLLATSTERNMRTGRLYVNDVADKDALKTLLHRKLETEKYQVTVSGETWTCVPLQGFYKLSHRLFGCEQITLQWGHELVIEGNLRAIGIIDDYLTWNKEVKAVAFHFGP